MIDLYWQAFKNFEAELYHLEWRVASVWIDKQPLLKESESTILEEVTHIRFLLKEVLHLGEKLKSMHGVTFSELALFHLLEDFVVGFYCTFHLHHEFLGISFDLDC